MDGARADLAVRRDSAGVTIVENISPAWSPGEEWTVDSMPLLAIPPDAGGHTEFQKLWGVTRLSDGTIVALDEREPFVRAFALDGTVLWTAVREGDGPGEIRSAFILQRLHGDSMSVDGDFSRRALLLDRDGKFVEELPMIPVGEAAADVLGRMPQVMMRMADGAGVGMISELRKSDVEGTSEPSWLFEYYVVHRDGSSRFLGRWPMLKMGILLAPVVAWAPLPDGFLYGWPTRDEFRVHDSSGNVRMLVRGPMPSRPPTDGELAAARQRYVEQRDDTPEERRSVERMPVADSISLYGRLVASQTGHIWRERYDPEADRDGFYTFGNDSVTWDVFTADGTLLGAVQLPSRFALADAGEDWIAGVHQDELDVQTPRVYRLVRR